MEYTGETNSAATKANVVLTPDDVAFFADLMSRTGMSLTPTEPAPTPDELPVAQDEQPTPEMTEEICACGGEDIEPDYLGWSQKNGLMDTSYPDAYVTGHTLAMFGHRLFEMFAERFMGTTAACTAPDAEGLEPLKVTDEELDILYRIAWAEARGECDDGIVGVINVILNRVNDRQWFPNQNTIRDVVFAPNQFEPIRNGMFDKATPNQDIKNLVHEALGGRDVSQGALFFNPTHLHGTGWVSRNRPFSHKIGNHNFYK